MLPHGIAVAHVNEIASVGSTLAAAQRQRGDRAIVIDPAKPAAGWPYPWKLLSLPARGWPIVRAARDIRRARPDLVHIHYATQAIIGPIARIPYVVHCHGSDVRGVRPSTAAGRYLRWVMGRARLVLYSTPDLADDTRRLARNAVYLPNPIDTQAFAPGGAPERDLLVGTRLDPVKGAETALRGVAELLRRRPDTSVTVVASGVLLPEARELLADRVAFVPPVPHEAMPALLRRHRVALGQFRLGILSQFELEAMASGLPVIADVRFEADATPAPAVHASDPAEIAGAAVRLLDDSADLRARSLAGRDWVEREHGAAMVVERLDEHYRAALAPPSR